MDGKYLKLLSELEKRIGEKDYAFIEKYLMSRMLALKRYINNTTNGIISFSENILNKISDIHSIELISIRF